MGERLRGFPTCVGLILLVAFGLRLGAAFWWEARVPAGEPFVFGDSESYWVLAGHIARGEPYEFGPGNARIFRTPGYPIVLASLYLLGEDEPPVIYARTLGAVLGTFAVGGVIWLTRKLFNQRAASIAGVMAALYPGAVGMSVWVLSEALFCPLMMAQLAGWTAAVRSESKGRAGTLALVSGLMAGLAALTRPSWLLFTPFAAGITVAAWGRRRQNLFLGTVMIVGLALAMLPWWIRNYGITGNPTLTTTQFGASLYDGLNPSANGGSDMRFVQSFYEEQLQADAASPTQPAGTFEERLDNRIRQAAISWARNHPLQVLQLAGIKLMRMWNPWPNALQFQSWRFRMIVFCGYTPLMLLAVGGALRFGLRNWHCALCVMPAFYFTCLHVVFVSSIRYRQPAMLALIVLAAAFTEVLWAKRCSTRGTDGGDTSGSASNDKT